MEGRPSIDVRAGHREVTAATCGFFAERGFERIEPEPLVPSRDRTILFTNSVVVPLKPYLEAGEIPAPGLVLAQRCLRTQNLRDLTKLGLARDLLCLFHMVGALAETDREERFARETVTLLTETLGIDPARLKLKLSRRHRRLLETWTSFEHGLQILVDTEPPSFYEWSFGMEEVHGVGATYSFVQGDGSLRDFGNFIEFLRGDRILAIGYGTGAEAVLASVHDLPRLAMATPITRFLPADTAARARLADVVAATVVLYREGFRPKRTARGSIVKRFVKAIDRLEHCLRGLKMELGDLIAAFEEDEYGAASEVTDSILAHVAKYGRRRRTHEIRRDLSLLCDRQVDVQSLQEFVQGRFGGEVSRVELFDVYEGPQIPRTKKSVGLALYLVKEGGTFSRREADLLIRSVLAQLSSAFPVSLRT